jgi:hypothetical protein
MLEYFDTSDYLDDKIYGSPQVNTVLSEIKDEVSGKIIEDFV